MKYLVLTLAVVGLLPGGVSCTSGPGGAEAPGDGRFRADAGEDILAGEGDAVTLRASGINGTEPFLFRWNVERAPDGAEDVTLSDKTAAETTTSRLTIQGRYVFRVVVVDAEGHDAYSFITVEVGPPGTGTTTALEVSIEGPETITPGETGELRAVMYGEGDFTYLWEVVSDSDVTLDSPDQPVTDFTVAEPGTVAVRVTVRDETANAVGAAEWTIEAFFEGGLAVDVSGPSGAEVNEVIEVTATVSNTNGEITYVWTVTDGEAELTNADTGTVSVRPTAVGRLAVQVEVTDAYDGSTATDEYVVTVTGSTAPLNLLTTSPDILKVGKDGDLAVAIEGGDGEFEEIAYAWEVVSGDAALDDPSVAEPVLTASKAETIQLRVEVTAAATGVTRVGEAEVFVVTIAEDRPQVVLTFNRFDDMVFELRPDVAPKTVANFLHYVDDGFYDGAVIHRVAKTGEGEDFVIQGGGFRPTGDGDLEERESRDPVPSEADNGLSNVRGTVAMALQGEDVDSGTSQWFVNMQDNSEGTAIDLDAHGFTVFASVVDPGMDTADAIAAVETGTRTAIFDGEPHDMEDVPVENVIIESIKRRSAADQGDDEIEG